MIAKLKSKSNTPWFKLMRAAAMAIVAMVLVFSCTTTAFAEDHENDFSFYKISSAASMHYDDSHNAATDEARKGKFVSEKNGQISMADAGAFVGFIDEDYGDGFIGSTVSKFSSSQQTRTYSSLEEAGIRQYAEYGHALQSLGLDSTSNESLDIGWIVRLISGFVLAVFYGLAMIAEQFFGFIIKILEFTNPFALFGNMIEQVGGWVADMFSDSGITGDVPQVDGMYEYAGFEGLREFVESWYQGLYDMGFVLAVIIFAVTLGIAIMTYKSQQGKVKTVIRTFITRIAFLVVGIPLLGMTYTVSLDLASDFFDVSKNAPAANRVLMSTLVDFESWAVNGNLALPTGTQIVVDLEGDLAGTVDMDKTTSPREFARRINTMYSPVNVYSTGHGEDWTVDFWGNDNNGTSSVRAAFDVIGRYWSSAFYHGSDYETAYKKEIRAKLNDEEEKAFFDTIKNKTGKYEEYAKDGMSLTNDRDNAPYLWNGRNDGYGTSASDDYSDGGTITFTGQDSGTADHNMGLSSLSMYNYLTTVFNDSSVETYSPVKITSKLAVHSHRSVNTVGDGVMSALYFINMLAMFFAIIIIGIGYAFGLLINMFGRGVKMISSVPFSLLGNMRAMAKVSTIVAMMCVEMLATFFIYSIVIELLISLQGIIETPMADMLNGWMSTSTVLAGGVTNIYLPIQAITMAGTLIMTVFYIVFGLKAMKWRKSIVKAIDEAVAGVIDRIFSPNPQGGAMSNAGGAGTKLATKPSLGDKAKDLGRAAGGAVMAGAGMAAGQALAAKAGDKLGLTAGSAEEVEGEEKDGTAENAGGADQEEVQDGGMIQGGERQGLPSGDDTDEVRALQSALAADTSGEGQAILAANADSLGDLPSSNGVDGEFNGIAAGDVAQAEGSEYESNDVNVSDDDIKNVDAGDSDTKQLAADAELARATGQTSAMEDECDSELKKKERKEAGKDAVKGVAKTAEGVAKGAAGYAIGDAQLMAEGAKDGAEGVAKTAKAGKRAADADTKVDSARARKTEQKNAQGQGAAKARGQQNAKPANGQNPSQSKPTKGHASVPPAGVTKATSAQQSSMKVDGGKSSVVNNGGTVNVNAPKATQQQAAGQKSAQSVAKQKAKAQAMSRRQAELKRAEKVLAKDGKVTLSNGKVVRNMSELRNMQRNTQIAEKALQDGITHATTVAGMAAAKSLTDKKKKDDDGFF